VTSRAGRTVRPVKPLVPLSSCVTVLLAWGLVAHNSGAGWVQAVGDVLAGILLVGLGAPALACARARVTVTDNPSDATAGLPLDVGVRASSRVRIRPTSPSGPESFVGPCAGVADLFATRRTRVAGAGDGPRDSLVLLPERRGVHDRLVLDVASAAPFGLLWWRKTLVVELTRPLLVGPRLGEPFELPRGARDSAGDGPIAVPAPIGVPRGVRPYRPGDHRRFVHWPATAHSGQLMVREMEAPAAQPVTVEVRLPVDEEAAEKIAERALATVVALVDRGISVLLATTEDGGPRLAEVGDRRSASRRLARAVAEPTSEPS
jgi:uncharacterized protein (DUF58 family)